MKQERAKRATITFLALVILIGSISVIAGYYKEVSILPTTFKVVKSLFNDDGGGGTGGTGGTGEIGGGGETEIYEGVIITSEDSNLIIDDGELTFYMPDEIESDEFEPYQGNLDYYEEYTTFQIVNNNDFPVDVNFSSDNTIYSNTDLKVSSVFVSKEFGVLSYSGKNIFESELNGKTITIPAKTTSDDISFNIAVYFLHDFDYDELENMNNSATVSASFDVIQAE